MDQVNKWVVFLGAVGAFLQLIIIWAFATGRWVGQHDRRSPAAASPSVPPAGEERRLEPRVAAIEQRMETANSQLSQFTSDVQELLLAHERFKLLEQRIDRPDGIAEGVHLARDLRSSVELLKRDIGTHEQRLQNLERRHGRS